MAAKTFLYPLDNDDDLSWPLSVFQAFFNIDDQRSTEHMNWWQKVGFFSWSCKKLTGWTLNLKFLDCSLNIHLLHILSLRNYVDFIYFAAGRRGANLGYCRSPGGQLRHVPVGAVRHSLRRHQEVPARLLRELLQRGPHQDPAHQRGQGALPPRQPSGRRHREFYWSIVSLLLCLCHFVFWNSIILTAASSSNFFGWKQTGASTWNTDHHL